MSFDRRFVGTAAAMVVAATLLFSGCAGERWEWHQKLTVEVETPNGPVSGAAVTSVSWQQRNWSGNFPGAYHGEATMVDLGQGRYLFALLGEQTRYLALHTFSKDLGEDNGITEKGFAAMARFRGMRDLPRDRYPMFVTFTDISDPTTVREVDPENLAATFGLGVSLRRITLEITDEAVTEGKIEKVLGPEFFRVWAKLLKDALKRGGIDDPYFKTFGSDLTRNDFIQE